MPEVPIGVMTKDYDINSPLDWNFSVADIENTLVWYKDNLTEDGINDEKLAELAKSCSSSVKYAMKSVYDELGLTGLAGFMDALEKQLNASRKLKMAYEHMVKVSRDPTAEHVPEWELAGDMDEIYACISKCSECYVPYGTATLVSFDALTDLWAYVICGKIATKTYMKTAAAIEDPILKEEYYVEAHTVNYGYLYVMETNSYLFEAIRIAGGVY